jgi:D-alanyl-D-alanine carboxypeptidase
MRRTLYLLAGLTLLLSAACETPVTPPLPPSLHESLDSLLAAVGPEAGLGVSAAVAGGSFDIWAGTHGFASPGGAPVVPATVFQVGSVTKQFTAAAIMRLVESGALDLEDELTAHLPHAPVQGHPVRIRHLLEHTSGVPDYTDHFTDPWSPVTRQAVLDTIAAHPFHFAPGASWRYSNSGYYLLGLLIEEVSGQEYAAFLRQHLLDPAGLTATSVCGHAPNHSPPVGYVMMPPRVAIPPVRMELAYAAGALCSTAGDLVRWARALGRGEVVSAASYARMTQPAVLNGGQAVPHGFGLFLVPRDGRAVHQHPGGIPGFQAQLAYYPGEDVAVAVLINQMPTDPVTLEQLLADRTLAALR